MYLVVMRNVAVERNQPRSVGSWTGPMMREADTRNRVGGKLWCNTSHCAADNMIIRGGRIRRDGTRLTYA